VRHNNSDNMTHADNSGTTIPPSKYAHHQGRQTLPPHIKGRSVRKAWPLPWRSRMRNITSSTSPTAKADVCNNCAGIIGLALALWPKAADDLCDHLGRLPVEVFRSPFINGIALAKSVHFCLAHFTTSSCSLAMPALLITSTARKAALGWRRGWWDCAMLDILATTLDVGDDGCREVSVAFPLRRREAVQDLVTHLWRGIHEVLERPVVHGVCLPEPVQFHHRRRALPWRLYGPRRWRRWPVLMCSLRRWHRWQRRSNSSPSCSETLPTPLGKCDHQGGIVGVTFARWAETLHDLAEHIWHCLNKLPCIIVDGIPPPK